MRNRIVVLTALVGTMLVASACGGSSPNVAAPAAATTQRPTTPAAPTSTAPPSPSPSPSASPSAAPSSNGRTILVQGLAFTPDDASFAKGTTITLDNSRSSEDHTFTVNGTKIDVVLHSGETKKVTLKLSPGTYIFVCTYHEFAGMTGQLTITH